MLENLYEDYYVTTDLDNKFRNAYIQETFKEQQILTCPCY